MKAVISMNATKVENRKQTLRMFEKMLATGEKRNRNPKVPEGSTQTKEKKANPFVKLTSKEIDRINNTITTLKSRI